MNYSFDMCAYPAGFMIANFPNLKKHKQPSKCVLVKKMF